MQLATKYFETKNGIVEGVQAKWQAFNILFVAGKKGFLACGAFDEKACDNFGIACAIVNSSPENPIGTLENFPNRTIKRANEKAKALGITEGMEVMEAFAVIA